MDQNVDITPILSQYRARRNGTAIALAFEAGKHGRLLTVPAEIQAIPDLADAWKCGQALGDEEHAFALGYQAPNDPHPPEEVRRGARLLQEFRNGQAARQHLRAGTNTASMPLL
jgi:hypothetical protein